jgi:hypothetical protein
LAQPTEGRGHLDTGVFGHVVAAPLRRGASPHGDRAAPKAGKRRGCYDDCQGNRE